MLLSLTCPELRNHVLQSCPHKDALQVALPLGIQGARKMWRKRPPPCCEGGRKGGATSRRLSAAVWAASATAREDPHALEQRQRGSGALARRLGQPHSCLPAARKSNGVTDRAKGCKWPLDDIS